MKQVIKLKKRFECYKCDWCSLGINLSSSDSEDVGKYSVFSLYGLGRAIYLKIPPILKPKSKWVDLSNRDWATPNKDGRKGYTDHIKREYGFNICDDAIHLHYGIQPGSWSSHDKKNSDHTKLIWIPWKTTRRVRYDFFRPNQSLFTTVKDYENGRLNFDLIDESRNSVPKIKFKFKDFDGEENVATCHITEMEWRYGTGWFKWIGIFKKPIINRTLNIEFEKETGRQKGSWKGGTTGTGIRMTADETPLTAFKRYALGDESQKYYGIVNREFTDIEIIKENYELL